MKKFLEGKFDKETTELSRMIMKHIGTSFSSSRVPPNTEFNYGNITATFNFQNDWFGQAPDIEGAVFDTEDNTLVIDISWPVNPKSDIKQHLPAFQGQLKSAIRHELEHYRQNQRAAGDSSWLSNFKQHGAKHPVMAIDPELMDSVFVDPGITREYFLHPLEVEAFVLGAYKQAKSSKQPLSSVLKADLDHLLGSMERGGIAKKDRFVIGAQIWNAWKTYAKRRLPKAILEHKGKETMKSPNLKDLLPFWEQATKSWETGEPEASHQHQPSSGDTKEKVYKKPKVFITSKETPSGMNTLEEPREFVPGKDKDADVMQLDSEQNFLDKLQEELESLADVEEGMITPDHGTSILARSLFSGAAVAPPVGYSRNFDPSEPAPEELPPGYEQNFDPDAPAPEEKSGPLQNQDIAGTIIAPKQWVPRESVHKRLAEQLHRQRMMKLGKL